MASEVLNKTKPMNENEGASPLVFKRNRGEIVRFLLMSAAVTAFFAFLASKFPLTGDDWGWGSYLGENLLKVYFDDYNGRYIGNLLVLALTRSSLLDLVVKTLCFFAFCFLLCKYSGSLKAASVFLAFTMFINIAGGVFSQSVIWTAGFANYVPSAIISAVFVILSVKAFDDELPDYPKSIIIALDFLGFIGALFMENITLFNLALVLAVVIYSKIKFGKPNEAFVGILIGAASGTVLMFSNKAYLHIFLSDDGYKYRDINRGFKEIIGNLYRISQFTVHLHRLLLIMLSLLLLIYAVNFLKKKTASKSRRISVGISVFVNLLVAAFYLVIRYSDTPFTVSQDKDFDENVKILYMLLFIAATVVYFCSVAAIAWFCSDKRIKAKLFVPLLSVPVCEAPLLLVTPIGSRCFFIVYLFMCMFLFVLFDQVMKELSSRHLKRLIYVPVVIFMAIMSIGYISSLSEVNEAMEKRMEYIYAQVEAGEKKVLLFDIPHNDIIFDETPDSSICAKKFNAYYGFDSDIKYKVIDEDKLDGIMKKKYGFKIETSMQKRQGDTK